MLLHSLESTELGQQRVADEGCWVSLSEDPSGALSDGLEQWKDMKTGTRGVVERTKSLARTREDSGSVGTVKYLKGCPEAG